MAGPQADEDLIEIPSDMIALGADEDGLPKAIPGAGAHEPPKAREPDPEVKTLRQRLADAEASRQRVEREAQERLQAESQARRAAESEAEKNLGLAANTHMAILQERKNSIAMGLRQTQETLAASKRELKQALADGNHDLVADLQERIGVAAADLRTYQQGEAGVDEEITNTRARYQSRPEPKKDEPAPEVKTPAAPRAPTNADEFIAGVPAPIQGWLKENRVYADPNSDENVDFQAFAQKWLRKNGGNAAAFNTEAFRDALESQFTPKEPDVVDEPEVKPEPRKQTRAPASAPVARSDVYSSRNPNAGKVRLPPKLAAFVKQSGLDPTKYALQAIQDIKEGKLPPNFLDADYDHTF